jgi:hypothetical protein
MEEWQQGWQRGFQLVVWGVVVSCHVRMLTEGRTSAVCHRQHIHVPEGLGWTCLPGLGQCVDARGFGQGRMVLGLEAYTASYCARMLAQLAARSV